MRVGVRLSDDSGATAVIVAILILVLVGMLSLAVDGGILWAKYRGIRTANDAAALAAAVFLALPRIITDLGGNDLYTWTTSRQRTWPTPPRRSLEPTRRDARWRAVKSPSTSAANRH